VGSSHTHSSQGVEEKSLLPAIQGLLHGIAVHAVKGDPEDDRQFRTRLHKISESVAGEPPSTDILTSADSAVVALRDHNDRTSRYHHAEISELRSVIQILVGTLEDLAVAGPKLMARLREIEKQLTAVATPSAVREFKLNLSQCLTEIRSEAERHNHHSGAPGSLDPVTGLEGRPAAEAALAQACASATSICAVVLLVDRLALYNRRYGRDVGDKVLNFFVEFVKRSFQAGPDLYRWTGPALLLLRHGSPDGIQAEMRRSFDPRIEFEVDSGSRSILLTLGVDWSVLPMMVDPRLVVNKIDAFVSE
jgi:GGDEF domain-containing protein